MKSSYVGAGEEQERIARSAQIEFRHAAIVHAPEVTRRHRGPCTFTAAKHRLHAEKDLPCAICLPPAGTVVNCGLSGGQQL